MTWKSSSSACIATAVVAMFVAAAPAWAGQAPQPLSPADGETISAGAAAPPTFVVDPGAGSTNYLWVHVSTSPAVDSTGVIGSDVTLGSLAPAPGAATWTWSPTRYTFPGYWLVTPGTYYWQPYMWQVRSALAR